MKYHHDRDSRNYPRWMLDSLFSIGTRQCFQNVFTMMAHQNFQKCLQNKLLQVSLSWIICDWKLNFILTGRSHLVPIVGHSLSTSSVWRLNTSTLKFPLNGPLPYDKVCWLYIFIFHLHYLPPSAQQSGISCNKVLLCVYPISCLCNCLYN